MEWLSTFLKTPVGKVVGAIVGLGVCYVVFVQVHGLFGSSVPSNMLAPMFVDSQTGQGFHHTLVLGERIPVYSPYSGSNTGYPAELCYWNADGTIRKDPTPVLLNSYIGKPGPTFCPVCGRLVVAHNPMPGPNSTPPPTREEYERMHATSGT